jgi:hypothetical protein
MIHHVKQAATFIELRLNEAQSMIRGFWNREGTNINKGPEMDRLWWTWNIALALSPAAAIAIGMELWGKPYVEKRNKEIEEFQRNKLGLLSEEEEEEAYAKIKSGNSITSIMGGGAAAIPSSPTPSQQETSQLPQPPTTESSNDLNTAPEFAADDMSIEALARRLQLLEKKLERQNQQLEHQRKYNHQRQNQSGIRNRAEDKLLLQERNAVLKRKQNKLDVANSADSDAGTASSSPTVFDFAFATIQENLRAKGEALADLGRSVLDPTSESSSDSTSSSSSRRNAALPAEADEKTVEIKNVTDAARSAQEAAQHASVAAQAAQQVSNDVLEQIQRQQNGEQSTSSSWSSSWSKIFGAGSATNAKPSSDNPTGQPRQA